MLNKILKIQKLRERFRKQWIELIHFFYGFFMRHSTMPKVFNILFTSITKIKHIQMN